MKKQIRLSELMGALSRNGLGHFPSYEIEELKREVKNSENSLLLEYIPVKLVASLEEGFRQQYKSIIDSPFYRKNLKDVKYLKDTKFDFEVISAFEDNEITLGDYISYLLPCNNVQDIISNLNELLGVEFFNKLQEFLSGMIGRCAVPLFFAISGYLFFLNRKLKSLTNIFSFFTTTNNCYLLQCLRNMRMS